MRQAISLLTLTVMASGAIAALRAVGFDGAQASSAGQKVMGVATFGVADGQDASVVAKGTAIIETGGAFARGAALRVDAHGRAVAADSLAAAVTAATDLTQIAVTVDDTKLTVDAGDTPVTSAAANGAVISAAEGLVALSAAGVLPITTAQAALSGGELPQFVFADALEASGGAGEFVEVLLRH
jgi:hypothetical protein